MKKYLKPLFISLLFFFLSVFPATIYAQEAGAEVIPDTEQTSEAGLQSLNPVTGGETSGQNPIVTSGEGPLYPTVIDKTLDSRVAVTNKDGKTVMTCEGVRNKGICDPTLQDVTLLGLSIARFLVGLAGGVVILMLCYGGFNYISGYMQGSEGGSEKGKTIITNAIIGLILVLTSYLIVTMFQSTLTSKTFVEETQNGGTEGVLTSITTDRTSSNNYLNNTQVSSTTNVNASASQTGSGISIKQNGTREGIIAFVQAKYGTNGKPAENGNIDIKKLKNFKDNETYPEGGYLIHEAADQWIAFVKYMKTQSKNFHIGSTYRDLAGQQKVQGGGMAAPLGTSMHGWGVAFDVSEFYRPGHYTQLTYKRSVEKVYNSDDYKWFTENIAKYGFYNPEGLRNDWQRREWYVEGAGELDEPWHFEYYGGGIGKTLLATIESGDCKNIAMTVNLGNSIKAQLNENPSCSLEDRDGILAMEEAMNNYNAEQENLDAESELEDLEMEGNSVSGTTEDPFLNSDGSYAGFDDSACTYASTDWSWNKIMAFMKADINSCNKGKPSKNTKNKPKEKPKRNLPNAGKFNGLQDVASTDFSAEIKAMLDTIAFKEGTSISGYNGYDVTYAWKRFTETPLSIPDHPRDVVCSNNLCSSAAGRYQFLSTTYDDLNKVLKINDFSPKSQDLLTVVMLKDNGVYDLIQKGEIEKALKKPKTLGNIWASFPYSPYGQQKADNNVLVKEISAFFRKRVLYYKKQEQDRFNKMWTNNVTERDATFVSSITGGIKFPTGIKYKNADKFTNQDPPILSKNTGVTPSIFLVGHSYGKLLCDNHFKKSESRYKAKCSVKVGENINQAVKRVKDEKGISDWMIIFTGVNDYKSDEKTIRKNITELWKAAKGKAKRYIFIDSIRYVENADATRFSDTYLGIVKKSLAEVDKTLFTVYINPNDYNNLLRDGSGNIPAEDQKYIFDFGKLHQKNDKIMVEHIFNKINQAITDKSIRNGKTY